MIKMLEIEILIEAWYAGLLFMRDSEGGVSTSSYITLLATTYVPSLKGVRSCERDGVMARGLHYLFAHDILFFLLDSQ